MQDAQTGRGSSTARILCPDSHPERYSKPAEAFKAVARALRDEVLPDPDIETVLVLVGAPGSGKSYAVAEMKAELGPAAVILDACHSDPKRRASLAARIVNAGKRAIVVHVQTPLECCAGRDARRSPEREVGILGVTKSHREIKRHPPTRSEGWHEVRVVHGHQAPPFVEAVG